MSHIKGHVDDPPKSCGKLSPVVKQLGQAQDIVLPNFQFHFVPPDWAVKTGQDVGFHVLTVHTTKGDRLIAFDVVPWIDHEDTELIAQYALESEKSLEKMLCEKNAKKYYDVIEAAINNNVIVSKVLVKRKRKSLNSAQKNSCKEVLKKTAAYVNSYDFRKFYIDSNGQIKDPNQVMIDIWRSASSIPVR
jgi:hypothetical protein